MGAVRVVASARPLWRLWMIYADGVRAVKSEPFANDLTRVADDDLDV